MSFLAVFLAAMLGTIAGELWVYWYWTRWRGRA